MKKLDALKEAQLKYRAKSLVTSITFGPNDRELVEAIKADKKEGFTPLVRRLLCEHYGIKTKK